MSATFKQPVWPTPSPFATGAFLAGLAITPFFTTATTSSRLAHDYAVGVALSFAISLLLDYRRELRNLVRADLMAIGSLYFLTLFEFLLPQPAFDQLVSAEAVAPALHACLIGFAGLALGRHFSPPLPRSLLATLRNEVPPKTLITLYTICFIGGFFYMLMAVDWDFFEMMREFMGPRFTQNWARGRLGDWKALLGEFGMVLYLVPPIAGIVFARRATFTTGQKLYVVVTFLFTMFYGYSSGTRNIFATYLATFLVAYAFVVDPQRKRELISVGLAVGALMLGATTTMLNFRTIGFANYWAGVRQTSEEKTEQTFFVDYNLYVISRLIAVFPERHDYLGFEIPYLSIIRPIPRAIWSGKPEGLSLSIEDAVGVEGLTLASSFIGEAYMSGGPFGVLLTGLVFGMFNAWWNRLARPDNSSLGYLVFASGFFAAVISMRSMFVFTTAMLPTIMTLVLGNWLLSQRPRRRADS